jgi:Spy/CpxP family protein refolding chaperone
MYVHAGDGKRGPVGATMKKRIAAVVGLVAAAGLIALAVAERPIGRHRGFDRIAAYLDLTDAQKTQVKQMWQAEKPAVQPLLEQLSANRKAMLVATANGKFDETAVRNIATQQANVMSQLAVERERLISQVYNQVLTADQRTKADQFRQKRADRMNAWLQRIENDPIR